MSSSTMRHFLPIKGAYLELIESEHVDYLYQLFESNRDYLRRCIPGIDAIRTREDLQRRWGTSTENSLSFGLWLDENQLVGRCRLTRYPDSYSADIGYWLSESFQGHGLMTSAVEQLTKYAFEKWNVRHVEIHCSDNNFKSRAIPERLGFTNQGISQTYLPIQLNGQIMQSITYSKSNPIQE